MTTTTTTQTLTIEITWWDEFHGFTTHTSTAEVLSPPFSSIVRVRTAEGHHLSYCDFPGSRRLLSGAHRAYRLPSITGCGARVL